MSNPDFYAGLLIQEGGIEVNHHFGPEGNPPNYSTKVYESRAENPMLVGFSSYCLPLTSSFPSLQQKPGCIVSAGLNGDRPN